MIIAHHLIWTVYGWWLPNDPRGSSSHEIRAEPLAALGPIHLGRKRPGPSTQELRHFHASARDLLAHEPLLLTEKGVHIVGQALGQAVDEHGYTCYACAVLPEHVHLLVRRHRDKAEQMLEEFQLVSRQALLAAGHRAPTHPVWGGPGWKVFLDTPQDVKRIERYVCENPLKAGRALQHWRFVKRL